MLDAPDCAENMLFAAEHPSHGKAIEAADQVLAIEHLDAVCVAEPVKFDVGLDHRRGDPGAATLAGSWQVRAGFHYRAEAGVGTHDQGGGAQPAATSGAEVDPIRAEHRAP